MASMVMMLSAFGQSAPLDPKHTEFRTDPEKSEIQVDFRLIDGRVPSVPGITATASGHDEEITTRWADWSAEKIPATAWLIIIDNSDQRRGLTITENVRVVTEFVDMLPERDAFTVHTLARELVPVTPFGTPKADATLQIGAVRPGGTEALVTLIHQSVREGLRLLEEREEPRKAVLLLTDGIDETPGGPEAILQEKTRLVEAAKEGGVIIHTLCYAEQAAAMTYFGAFREISIETGGIHIPAEPADRRENSRKIPDGSINRILSAMQGSGTVVLNVSALKDIEPVPGVIVEVATESGGPARILVPAEEVAKALAAPEPPVTDPAGPDATTDGESEPEEATEGPAAAPDPEPELADDDATEEESRARLPWLWILIGLLVLLGVTAFVKIRAQSRRRETEARAAEEAAQLAIERDEAERRRTEPQSESETRKALAKPLAWLEMCDDSQTKTAVTMSSMKIGRGRHNDLVLRNDSVSGNHCVINRGRDGGWVIHDLGSGNGTLVNGQPVSQSELRHGDLIELGEIRVKFLHAV